MITILFLACGGKPHWSEDPATSRKMVIDRDERIVELEEANLRLVKDLESLKGQLESKWYETEQAHEFYVAKLAREREARIEKAKKSWCSLGSELIDIVSYGDDSHHVEGSSCGSDATCRRCKVVLKGRFTTPPNDTLRVDFSRGCDYRSWKPSDPYCYGKPTNEWWMSAYRRDGTIAYYEVLGIGVTNEY